VRDPSAHRTQWHGGRPSPLGTVLPVDVLVVGSGAREHALLLALRRDPAVGRLVCAPGNAGTASVADARPLDVADPAAVAALARQEQVDLVVVGPEVPLVAGAADAVRAAGIACFGPSAEAAQIEGSKAFAKQVMAAAGVPTASAEVFDDAEACAAHLAGVAPPYVVKADGLAAGKGVHVGSDLAVAAAFARDALDAPGARVVVEAYLDGPEVSLFALTDGTTVVPLLPAQDHKRVGDGDTGPNTGGMGAYAPLPWLPSGTVARVQREVLQPVVDELRRRGTPFAGLLYAGLALTSRGPQVVEFNCRFGDPETQVVLALLETPLAGLLLACATGALADAPPVRWHEGAAVTVVVAAEGYPGAPARGDEVRTGATPSGVEVLHAGTVRDGDGDGDDDGDRVVASGGRVLSVTAVAEDLAAARAAAYDGVAAVELRGGHWRSDIALAAVEGTIAVP
jgi:phosphoribosylamine--glycine ligase